MKAADLVTKAVAKNEEGNLVYGLSKPIDDDVTFWAYAIWEDEAALKYHLQSSYAKKFLEYNLVRFKLLRDCACILPRQLPFSRGKTSIMLRKLTRLLGCRLTQYTFQPTVVRSQLRISQF